jgi:hypothetical protein
VAAQGRDPNEAGQIELNLAAGSGLPRFYRFSAPASGLFLSFLRNFWGT